MKKTYATTLTCNSCLAKAQPHLEAVDGLRSWSLDTESPEKWLTVDMKDRVDPEDVVRAVEASGFEATISSNARTPNLVSLEIPSASGPEKEPFQLSRYKPLLLVVGYVLGGALFLELLLTRGGSGGFDGMRFMRHFMGLFFIGFAFFKLLDVTKFADAFGTYDVVAKRSRGYALLYPFLELTLGLAYLFNVWPLPTNVVTALIMAVGLIGVVSVVRRGETIQCACLGTAFNLPMSVVTIIENSVMLLMALAGLIR